MEACAFGPCPVREGDWGSGTFCRLVGAWVGAAGGGLGSTPEELPSVFGASVGLVLFGAESDGLGAGELQGVAFWLVRGTAALVLAHANCTLFFTSRAAFVCKKKTRSFRVFPPQN